MKKITALLLGIVFLTMGLVYAQQAPNTVQAAQPIQVGNKFCPVSGGPVKGEMGNPVQYVYKGKVYNLCCGGCLKTFKSNPEKYGKIAEAEVAAKK